jgi:hypothetical protein
MISVDEQLHQALQFIKTNRKVKARKILSAVMEDDRDNPGAWWLLFHSSEAVESKKEALENVLRLVPQHEKAKKAFANLEEAESQRQALKVIRKQQFETIFLIALFLFLSIGWACTAPIVELFVFSPDFSDWPSTGGLAALIVIGMLIVLGVVRWWIVGVLVSSGLLIIHFNKRPYLKRRWITPVFCFSTTIILSAILVNLQALGWGGEPGLIGLKFVFFATIYFSLPASFLTLLLP